MCHRHREHQVCICCCQGHHPPTEPQGVQPGVNGGNSQLSICKPWSSKYRISAIDAANAICHLGLSNIFLHCNQSPYIYPKNVKTAGKQSNQGLCEGFVKFTFMRFVNFFKPYFSPK